MTACPHNYYREVESCAICEAEEERDEARKAARAILRDLDYAIWPGRSNWMEKYPWLIEKETGDEECSD